MKRLFPLVALLALVGSVSARAEIAVLNNGRTFKLASHRVEGDQVWLVLKEGGEVALPTSAIRGYVPDEVMDEVTTETAAGSDLRSLAVAAARRHGLDPDLVLAVASVESAFVPTAVSPKGAQGLMQLMPATARALGVTDAFDPEANLDGGARHLQSLIERYKGDVEKALAAYNAGERAVERYKGVPPYRETRSYVKKVLKRYQDGSGS
jgi:soluble lytic murein transglycosylase-like protein